MKNVTYYMYAGQRYVTSNYRQDVATSWVLQFPPPSNRRAVQMTYVNGDWEETATLDAGGHDWQPLDGES